MASSLNGRPCFTPEPRWNSAYYRLAGGSEREGL
jgi:hypothetical protein